MTQADRPPHLFAPAAAWLASVVFLSACDGAREARTTQAWISQTRSDAQRQAGKPDGANVADIANAATDPQQEQAHAERDDKFANGYADPFAQALAGQTIPANASAAPPVPVMRALGVLLRQGQAQAILQVEDRILRLRAGQSLPTLPGKVLRVSMDEIELLIRGQTLRLTVGPPRTTPAATTPPVREDA